MYSFPSDTPSLHATSLHTLLKAHFGFDQFRDGQEEVIKHILEGIQP